MTGIESRNPQNPENPGSDSVGRGNMKNLYTAIIKKDGEWWVGWIEEVPGVNCQESTREELMESLKITLREALEFNRQEAVTAAGNDY
jgi:predicted RNase H-like HicB family nuclease